MRKIWEPVIFRLVCKVCKCTQFTKKVYKYEQCKQMRTLAVWDEKVGTCNTICGSYTESRYHLKI